MNKYMLKLTIIFICIILGFVLILSSLNAEEKIILMSTFDVIKLPDPVYDSNTSIERALLVRRSIREYKDEPLTLMEISQLLWAAQGCTDKRGYRTAPSAGALYPLELYIIAGNVIDLPEGIYRYKTCDHELERILEGDKRIELSRAALGQSSVRNCAAIIVISALYEKTTIKYGERGVKYVHIEVGHAAQNVYLQAISLNLGTVFIGAFYDNEVKKIIKMKENEVPLGIMPIGKKKR